MAAAQAVASHPSAGFAFQTAGPTWARGLPFPLLELIAGCAIMLTIVLPWVVMFDKVAMSWDVLDSAPGGVVGFVIVAWVIGLASVILTIALRTEHAALLHAVLGIVGVLYLVILSMVMNSTPASVFDEGEGGAVAMVRVLTFFNVLAWLGVVITTNLRLLLGDRRGVMAPQGVFAVVFVIVSILDLVMVIYGFSETPRFARSKMLGPLIVGIVCSLANMTAGILAGVHSFRTGSAAKTLSRAALALVYAVVTGTILYVIIAPAVVVRDARIILPILNMLLIVLPLVFLLCSGMIKWIAYVARQPGQPPRAYASVVASPAMVPAVAAATAAPAASGSIGSALEARLQSLATLRERGVISEQEYAVKRARILEDM